MTQLSTHRPSSIRAYLFAIALLLATALSTGAASAGVLLPAVDMGAPGGGGGAATSAEAVDLADSTIPGIRVF